MGDLAEHIGTILWITGGLLGIVGIFIALTWRDLNASLKEIKKESESFKTWLSGMEKDGGLVTRDKYFTWCLDARSKCIAITAVNTISQWRNDMLSKGGVLTIKDHGELCDHITEKLVDRIDECFAHHREWVGDQLQIIQSTMEGKVLKEISDVKKELTKEK